MRINENYWAMQAHYWFSRRWKPRRRWRAETILRFRNLVRSLPNGALAIDCGANVGDVTGVLVRDGLCVIAFEPDPLAFERLQGRFGKHPRVTLYQKAVGASAGTLQLYRTPQANAGDISHTISSTLFPHDIVEAAEGVTVEVVDLPAFLRSLDEPVALLKLDVEGAETEIVQALLDGGHEHLQHVLVETHERLIPELADQTRALRERVRREGLSKFDLDWL